ncbi:Phospholipid-transporting ATPase [Entamoeba marina]
MIICCIPQISTVTPITSIIPLVLVLVVAAIKEIYEDIRRYLADRKFNNNKYIQRLNEEEIYVKSSKIKTGSLIKLQSDDIVPADCIPLSTINKDGVVYVETAAIDGETNLKQILVPPHFIDRPITTIWEDSGDLICEYPQPRFDQFRGSITTNDVKVSVNEKNLLLQGTVIRNTEFVYCLVCYCGKHTKLTLNQTKPKLKKSTIDFKFNVFVFVMIIIQCLLCLLLAILSAIRYNTINDEENGYWYLPKEDFSPLLQAVKKFFGYFTLISYIIPISCQVSLEFARFAQGLFIEADADMKIKTVSATGKTVVAGMNAKATALNDELGMVRYILTDKTGTLTENQMTFSNCSVGNVVYDTDQMKKLLKITGHDVIIQTTKTESIEDDIVVNDVDRNSTNTISNSQQNNNQDNVSNEINLTTPRTHSENIDDLDDKSKADSLIQLLMCMAMCNTISINNDKFTSPSPDEEALCKTAKNVGVQLIQRTQQKIKLFLFGKECEYHILSTFEFNSDRKRMSILLRDENGVISLWSKGADNIMKERCNDGFESLQHIEQFSKNGLRTLVLAHKIVGEETFSKWYEKYDDANNLLEGRDEAVDQLQSEMENEMCIIGVTAIEDQLQAGVPETIDLLKRGGIKIWIITGDKMETAINIGLSCDLLNEKYVCIAKDTQEECGIVVSTLVDQFEKKELTNFTLVINDRNVDWCIHDFQKDFVKLALASEGVVCCRVTPLQKAEITKCVKKMTKKTCLAIGDGANDVPMINTGDIGVGIFGKEGSQAARASDFAIRKFRHLGKLVLYHGRMSLLRNSTLIKMCFYKNASFFMILMWYSFISNHTCQIVYDDYIMTFFNIFFTQIQPIVTGVVERI